MIEKPSPNFDERGDQKISMIILHYTGMKSAEEALERLCDKEAKVSAHYTVDEEGEIYRHVDEEKRAWHAGKSFWQGEEDLNAVSIGIEIVNPGHEFGYREFPESQIDAVIALCQQIQERHDIELVLAHSDVAPDRKEDPGELFPWQKLAEKGVGLWPEIADEDMVKSASMDGVKALKDMGYKATSNRNIVIAFQRHFVPEVFKQETQGHICSLTRGRLYALLAGHLISANEV